MISSEHTNVALIRLQTLGSKSAKENLNKQEVSDLQAELLPADKAASSFPLPHGGIPTVARYLELNRDNRFLIALLSTLQAAGVETVTIEYSTAGNCTNIHEISIQLRNHQNVSSAKEAEILALPLRTPFGGIIKDKSLLYPESLREALDNFIFTGASSVDRDSESDDPQTGTAWLHLPEMQIRFEQCVHQESFDSRSHQDTDSAELTPEIQDYLETLYQEEPDSDKIIISFTTFNGTRFNELDSTYEIKPPEAFTQLAQELVEDSHSTDITFTFSPSSKSLSIQEGLIFETKIHRTFTLYISPGDFQLRTLVEPEYQSIVD
jgi:hypothetical protein